ncbi:MAG: type I secretion system permease/ATPase [Zoogloea oleivorans]|jgi:ATP-binding cassette subfamily C exporter for protease/lipase|uniref:type I secretion system permease/ATPase n=1 Tax=Zoogloea oleivorans TaxID=1552750 RepID=UPI002A3699A8|nr:type I secretion system permease/ATPase [Zoogloea oleivorans]MDY0036810.1 type I secretion system permease/ATPase [Zoogloea oleivorans]
MKPGEKITVLREALLLQKATFHKVIFFSFFINLLVMAPTVYMLQVYDRVVNSRSLTTLGMLTLMIVILYVAMEVLEWVRSGMLRNIALKFDAHINERLFNTVFEANLRRIPGAGAQAIQDLRTVRDFISSPALMAMIDVPLSMLYIFVIFMINPIMGWMSVVGALLQVGLAWLTERDTQGPLGAAQRAAIDAQNYASNNLRNAQVIEAMGMQGGIRRRWLDKQNETLRQMANASDTAGRYSAMSKFVQQSQSSLLLGAGCWLTIVGLFPGGGGLMIVASTLGGRLLAPIVQVIGGWKQVVGARDAYTRVSLLIENVALREAGMPLPAPTGQLSVEGVIAAAPGSQATILRGVSFNVAAGTTLGLIGPSASGKSTLARLLVGVWPAASGKVRLDGVDIYPWNKAELGPHMGYLPQAVELFDGPLAENIARFSQVDMDKVEVAARAVGIHEMIMALPDGYDTNIGDDGCFLSGGQRQRIGLARAIYGNPRVLVLDEPNSSLDELGEHSLLQTLLALKAGGTTVIVITHRTNVLAAVDNLLLLQDGQVKAHGPRDEVLAALQRSAQQAIPIPVSPGGPPQAVAA